MAATVSFQFGDIKNRTYKTPDRAKKRLEEFCATFSENLFFRGMVVATDEGRFVPCVVLNNDQQHYMGAFVHNGICVTF